MSSAVEKADCANTLNAALARFDLLKTPLRWDTRNKGFKRRVMNLITVFPEFRNQCLEHFGITDEELREWESDSADASQKRIWERDAGNRELRYRKQQLLGALSMTLEKDSDVSRENFLMFVYAAYDTCGYTEVALAHMVGASDLTISFWITGRKRPNPKRIRGYMITFRRNLAEELQQEVP